MKSNIICSLSLLSILLMGKLQAQESLVEKLNGVETNFVIVSDSKILNDSEQIIVHRTCFTEGEERPYQEMYFEFISNEEVAVKKTRKTRHIGYRFSFYNSNKKIGSVTIRRSRFYIRELGEEDTYAYSVSLENFPIALFNAADKIDIVRYKY